ncbi:MAG: hypothetical protein ACLVCH_04390 [Roseburia inulinivorans]
MPHQQAVQTHQQMLREADRARQEELKRLTQVRLACQPAGKKNKRGTGFSAG